jgi:uncharacterized membrane protein YgcG
MLPRAHVIRVVSGKDTRILHMFDAAGERFYHSERTQELLYLGKAQTLILVIDPLSVDSFWARLPAERRAELAPVRSDAPSPDLAYQQTHQEIEAMGVHLRQVRLAVVFSRGDLVDAPDGAVAAWACHELGLGNLIRSTRLNFKETRFFVTAAKMRDGASDCGKAGGDHGGGGDGTGGSPGGAGDEHNEVIDESVLALMRWIMADSGVALPGGKP